VRLIGGYLDQKFRKTIAERQKNNGKEQRAKGEGQEEAQGAERRAQSS